jgi:hypothetical protein
MWKRAISAIQRDAPAAPAPWYRRPELWLLVGVVVLPFGWLLLAGRFAWGVAVSRRGAEASGNASTPTSPGPSDDPSPSDDGASA